MPEASALYFYELATSERCATLLTNARKFAPIDTIQVGRIKKSAPRDLNFPAGVYQSQTNGIWDQEVILNWSQLVCNSAEQETKSAAYSEKHANLLDF